MEGWHGSLPKEEKTNTFVLLKMLKSYFVFLLLIKKAIYLHIKQMMDFELNATYL